MEKCATNKELVKRSNNKKRTREDVADAGDHEHDIQNLPPWSAMSSKRCRGEQSLGQSSQDVSSSVLKSSNILHEKEGKESFVTPSVFVSDGASQEAPGAPRILLINQQVNSGAPNQTNSASSTIPVYLQLLRTPPTKNPRLFLRKEDDEEYRGFDRFERISDEIILKIFHYLPRHMMNTCALVCRRWARIVCDMSLWQRVNMGGRLLKDGVLKILLERGVQVLRLSRSEILGDFSSTIHGSPDPCRSPLSEDRLYRLQLLDMSMANVKTSLVESMLKFCPNLTKISLENIPVTEQLLINLGFGSPCLQTLNLCMCEGVTIKGLSCIFRNCTSLLHLNLAWTCMSQADLKSFFKMLPHQLVALDISGNREKISDEDVSILCDKCSDLEDLDLSDSTEITNAAIDDISSKLKQLHKISLSRCYSINPNSLMNLGNLPNLQIINVFGMMRNTSLVVLEQYFKHYVVNKEPFSTIARPTTSNGHRAVIWNVSSKEKSY